MIAVTREYKSTDAGAPSLSGEVGSLPALLRACLVGSGGVAYGTGIHAKPSAGWSVAFEDVPTFKLALRNSLAAGGTGCYLRVQDAGTGAAGTREALVATFSDMSDIDTGADRTPSIAQVAAGGYCYKSVSADATPRAWHLIADQRAVWLNTDTNSLFSQPNIYSWGDINSFVPGDGFAFQTLANDFENRADRNINAFSYQGLAAVSGFTGLAIARNHLGDAGAAAAGFQGLGLTSGFVGVAAMSDPAPGIGSTVAQPAYVANQGALRGALRGCCLPLTAIAVPSMFATPLTGVLGRPTGSSLVPWLATTVSGGSPKVVILIERALSWDVL